MGCRAIQGRKLLPCKAQGGGDFLLGDILTVPRRSTLNSTAEVDTDVEGRCTRTGWAAPHPCALPIDCRELLGKTGSRMLPPFSLNVRLCAAT